MVKFCSEALASLIIAFNALSLSSNAFMLSPSRRCNNRRIVTASESLGRTGIIKPTNLFSQIPSNPTNQEDDEKFVNDGFFSWMQPFLNNFGYVEGKSVYLGGPGSIVEKSNFPSTEEQERLRKEARENMMNIGVEERERRRDAGQVAYKVVIGYAILSSLFLDDGSVGGHLARFAIALVRGFFFRIFL